MLQAFIRFLLRDRRVGSYGRRYWPAALWRAGVAVVVCALAGTASAQDSLRYSLAGEQAARARSRAIAGTDYNLRLGKARFLANAGLGIEANDNVTLRESDGEEDLILRPRVNTAVYWPLTERNALNFSLGLGYVKYLNQTRYDYLQIVPGSELSFELFVKDFRFRFFDRFAYTEDPLENGALSGVGNYGGLDNSTGVNALWDLNKAILTAGYAHRIFLPDQEEFEYLTRSSDLFFARAAFLLNSMLTIGPEASSGVTTYDQSFLDNAVSYSGGAFGELQVTPHLSVDAHAGYVAYEFETGPTSVETEDVQDFYFSAGLDHELNQFVTHSLTGGREIDLGLFSNFQELYYARYNVIWKIIRDVGLGTYFYYEHGTYPTHTGRLSSDLLISLPGETYDRYGVGVTVTYRLMQKLSANLGYRLTLKDSDTQYRGYTQNALILGLTYRF